MGDWDMSTERELLQKAVIYLEANCVDFDLIDAINNELAKPNDEPVAWMYKGPAYDAPGLDIYVNRHKPMGNDDWPVTDVIPLYTHPKPLKRLTDDEIVHAGVGEETIVEFARAIETALIEKNK
jgi:hypothetical protein